MRILAHRRRYQSIKASKIGKILNSDALTALLKKLTGASSVADDNDNDMDDTDDKANSL